MSKGSNPRPFSVKQEKFGDNWDQAFGEKERVETMRYLTDPETGKLIPEYMWDQYDMRPPPPPKSHFIHRDYQDYASPITGEIISGRRQHRYDLERNGCRVSEGQESEHRAANAHLAHEDKKLDQKLDKSMAETLNDIKYQNNPPPETDKAGNAKMSWTFGKD
jgi:uncharacterized protein Usg|tara:strand:- start:2754 stop:3242 length:489 start_codon:yes stop_codon:yes gene_type:complete